MKVDLQEIEPCVRKITIEIPTEEVEGEKTIAYRELAKTANIPGFRKGKAPRSVLEKKYSEQVHFDISQRLIRTAYEEALVSHNLRPVGDPSVEDIKLEAGSPLLFTATLEILPQLDITGLEEITLTRRFQKASDKEIDETLKQHQERSARFEPVEGRAVTEGDFAVIDYRASRDGEELPHFKGEGRQVEVKEGEMLDLFHKEIVGMEKGEEKEFTATMPDDFADEGLRGVAIDFFIKVNEIKEKSLPPIDDDLAKEVSEHDTIEEFRAEIAEQIEGRNRQMADSELRTELMEKLIEGRAIDLPPSLVERQAAAFVEREKQKNAQAAEGEGEEKEVTPSDAEIEEKCRVDAVRALKEQAIISSVGQKEEIQIDPGAVDREVAQLAMMIGQPVETVKAQLGQGDRLEGIAARLYTDKVFDFLLGKVVIEDQRTEKVDEE